MGTDRCTRTTLVARCCHGAFFGFGFVSTILTLTVMFWIAWCYFGLTILQISDTQRRALVNYSYVSAKPLPTPTTAVPTRSTTTATTQETSINSISKSPTTASILRGSSRGESQVKVDKKRGTEVITNLAKGDFAERVRETPKNATKNATALPPKDASVIPSGHEPSTKKDVPHGSGATAAILSGAEIEEADDRVYARRVLNSGTENRAEDKSESSDRSIRRNPADLDSASRLDISPTKVYVIDAASESLKVENPLDRPPREEARTPPRDYVDREKPDPSRQDDIQSSRRPDSGGVYREPDFDREYPKRYATSSDSRKYDDLDDERGSRGRYDKRERGRESDDRYSKGDTRVYPDEKILDRDPSTGEERYRVRERYPDDIPRRGDDDRYDERYRDYDEKPRIRDKEETRYRDRDLARPLPKNDRYKDEDSYRYRDEDRLRDRDDDKYRARDDDRYKLLEDKPDEDKYRSRSDVRYIPRDDDRYIPRDDEKYKTRDDDRYRLRDDDRYRSRDDDRYIYRDEERYRTRDDEKYRTGDDDKYRPRDDDRYRSELDDRRTVASKSKVEEDRYPSKLDDDTLPSRARDTSIREPVSRISSSIPVGDRKPPSSRAQYDVRTEESITDYDVPVRDRVRPPVRDEVNPSRISRPAYDEERYRDRDRVDRYRPTRYDEDEIKAISPTRTKVDSTLSRSTLIDSKFKDAEEDPRYLDDPRDRIRTDRIYDDDERIPGPKIQDSRSPIIRSENSRRYIDENDRYRTRLPNEKIENSKLNDRREEVVLDRRSYASEEEEDYRRGASRTRDYYEDRSRSPIEDTRRRYRDDESYTRRDSVVGDEFKRDRPKDDVSRDRSKSRDRYDDEYRRYDDKYISREEDRYPIRDDRLPPPARKYDTYPDDDDERTRRRDSESRAIRAGDSRYRDEIIRPSASSRDEERFYSRDDIPETKSSARRRYDDDLPDNDKYDTKDRDSDTRTYIGGSRRSPISREPVLGSSMSSMNAREPTDVVIREKRFQSSSNRPQNSRVINNERNFEAESESKEEVRPLSAKEVIEAAIRHSDNSDQNSRNVHYPVFDPRVSNLTSPDIIRPSERRGTTITARKRRSA